jgi:hypothetical protein
MRCCHSRSESAEIRIVLSPSLISTGHTLASPAAGKWAESEAKLGDGERSTLVRGVALRARRGRLLRCFGGGQVVPPAVTPGRQAHCKREMGASRCWTNLE